MIALLRGRIAAQAEDHVVIDVQGVGYLVHASARSLRRLPGQGEAAELLIETQVSDESIRLYGFTDEAERACFRLLQTVQGVGARVALSVLGVVGPDGLAAAVAAGDRAALTRAAGVGARLAGRILAELKDRVLDLPGLDGPTPAPAEPGGAAGDDALAALVRLGFARADAYMALERVRGRLGQDAALDSLIRESLRELTS
jgi:Holliday junction DNA helicase RuvA